jgi:GAF domain-containing protein
LLAEPEFRYTLLIGAYRDNEITASDPLRQTLDKLRATGVELSEIALGPLSLGDVTQLVIDSLQAGVDCAELLAQLIHKQTDGNPLFAIQFFKTLAEEKLLILNPVTSVWEWDLEEIRTKGLTNDIEELVIDKLDRLLKATLHTLKQLACLGSGAATSTVCLVSGKSEQALDAALLEAVRAGLVSRHNGSWKFVHDRVQEVAYRLIPEADRISEHLRIGRLLLEYTPPDQIEEAIFAIVNQLNRGLTKVTSKEERARLVELNLIAGRRAKAAAAYVSALNYLTISSRLLQEDGRQTDQETSFLVSLNIAECELLTGQLNAADERLSSLPALARSPVDRAAVTSLRVILYQTLNRSERAVEVCLEYLHSVDMPCPRNPTQEEVAKEYERVWLLLGKRTIEELVDLPLMTDQTCRGTLEVITAIVPASWFTEENLRNLLVARMVSLSLEYGNSDEACYAYALFARTLGAHFGDYRAGYRFGRLSLELVDRRGLERLKTRVYACFGHHIDPWNRHLRNSRDWLRLASAAAPQAGDLTFAAHNCVNTISNLLASGESLADVQVETERELAFARRLEYGLCIDQITTQRAYIRALRGLTPNLACFDDVEFDENQFEEHLDSDPELLAAKFRYWVRKMEVHFYAEGYPSAAAAANKIQELRWRSQSFVEVAEYPFFAALTLAAFSSNENAAERLQHLGTIAAHRELLKIWARNCPENFACMEALVAAEIARIEGRDLDAERLYENSLGSARENRFVHTEALANELAGKFYLRRGLQTVAYVYLRNARYCYLCWGATAKVRQIDQRYPGLTDDRVASLPDAPIDGAVDRLDSAAVVKALQAISGEIILGKLVKTLMKIVVEHSGAERGLFLLVRNNQPQISAEATTIDCRVEVVVQTAAVTTTTLPGSIVQYVMRTRESVILEDASIRNLFSDDDYLRRQRPKSVLCMPITRQADVVSILYLENNLTTHAFTSDRITVLKLLASQGAISLENARLYADLRQAEALLAGEKRVLEMMSRGDSLHSILGELCAVADESCDGWMSAILLLDANGNRLWYGAALRLSANYAQAINGVTVGPDFGPCSTAARLRETIVVSDISSDFRWPQYRALALEIGLRASWSTPIPSLKGEVMGSFDMYSRQPRTPDARELDIIKQMTHHAGVAIQRSQAEEALRKSEEALRASEQVARGQVEALTYSLDILATASEPEKFLGKMLSTICRLLNGESAALWLFDEPTDSLILRLVVDSVSQIGADLPAPVQNPRSWKEDPVIQELFFAAGPVVCEDMETDPRVSDQFRQYFMPKGTKKFLAVPILVGGKVRGIISVRHSNRAPYRTEEIG